MWRELNCMPVFKIWLWTSLFSVIKHDWTISSGSSSPGMQSVSRWNYVCGQISLFPCTEVLLSAYFKLFSWENNQWSPFLQWFFVFLFVDSLHYKLSLGFPGGSDGKESDCNAGDLGLIPGLERLPGEGNSYPL